MVVFSGKNAFKNNENVYKIFYINTEMPLFNIGYKIFLNVLLL